MPPSVARSACLLRVVRTNTAIRVEAAALARHTRAACLGDICAFQTACNAQPRQEKSGDRWASATPLNLQNSAGSATKRCGLDERGAGPAVRQTLVGVQKAAGQPRTSESPLLFA